MMKIAYFDCFSGISGDMCLGALVSAGVDFDLLSQTLNRLPITGYQIRQEKIKVQGIAATNIHVDLLEEKQPSRNLKDLMDIIQHSELPLEVKEKSEAVFQHLAKMCIRDRVMGINLLVSLAAIIPATRATPCTSPFPTCPLAINSNVSGNITTSPRAMASRKVGSFAVTSTIRALPCCCLLYTSCKPGTDSC